MNILNAKKKMIGYAENFYGWEYTSVCRMSRPGDFVTLPQNFNKSQVAQIKKWAATQDNVPSWEDWKRFLRSLKKGETR